VADPIGPSERENGIVSEARLSAESAAFGGFCAANAHRLLDADQSELVPYAIAITNPASVTKGPTGVSQAAPERRPT
jgi:hypothetical protein